MYRKKIIFFGTPIWELTSRHLKVFIEKEANIVAFVEANVENISTTVTKEDPYENITRVAKRLNIPSYCPRTMDDPDFIDYLKSFNADIFVICGFQFYLTKEILDIPPLGSINFHSSLLPRHAGMHPGFFTIYYGDKESGMVIHYMDSGIDTGDILYQSTVPVLSEDTIADLYDKIWDSSEGLIKQFLEDLDNGSLPRQPQDMAKFFYNYELSGKDFELDFRLPADILYGRIKMVPEKFYFIYKGQKYFILDASIVKEPETGRNYKLREPFIYNNKLTFITPRNYLQINKVVNNGHEMDPLTILG